jgi:hypothetical protein
MLEKAFRSKRVVQRLRRCRLGGAFDDFVAYLIGRGHPTSTIEPYVQAAEHFDGWLRRTRGAVKRSRISAELTLDERSKPVDAFPHVGELRGEVDPDTRRKAEHQPPSSRATTRANASSSKP